MGTCRFCGRSAGLLRSEHHRCRSVYDSGKQQIVAMVVQAVGEPARIPGLYKEIDKLASSYRIHGCEARALLALGWEQAVERELSDHILSEEEEHSLYQLLDTLDLSQDELDRGALNRVAQAGALRDILEGKLPKYKKHAGPLPFNLQKSETLVWIFQDVDYYEEKTRAQFHGGSQGFSFRVAKGVYYRTGGFRGERVQTSETVHADYGSLGATTKHIYFAGTRKRFRIRYDRIVTFEPYSDGIGIMRDAQSARAQTFLTGDGWFIYNLVTNLANM